MTTSTDFLQSRSTTSVIAATLAGLALVLAAPVVAAGDKAETKVETKSGKGEVVMIKVVRKDGEGQEHEKHATVIADCEAPGQKIETSEETKSDDGKTMRSRIVMCSRGHHGTADKAHMTKALEKARASISENKDLSDGARDKALAAIDRKLAELRDDKDYSKQ
jgi:hypothetical protein